MYKFVRERQEGSEVDLDFEVEQNTNNKPMTTKTRSSNRLTVNNRASPQTVNNTDVQTTMLSFEKKEFDYDFVSVSLSIESKELIDDDDVLFQANAILSSYVCGQLTNGIKFQVALTILDLCVSIGDKVLIFSQSLLSLNKLEEFLSQRLIPTSDQKWEKNVNYYRKYLQDQLNMNLFILVLGLDGGTSSLEREKLINAFNAPNSNAKLFLLSTR